MTYTARLLRISLLTISVGIVSMGALSGSVGRASEALPGSAAPGAATSFTGDLKYVKVNRFWIASDGSVLGVVKLTAPVTVTKTPRSIFVTLQSGNAGVASVPAAVEIKPGQDSATFLVRAVAAGCGSVIASYDGKKARADLVVNPASTTSSWILTVPTTGMYQGASYTGHLTSGANVNGSFRLSSSNPVVTVPTNVSIPQGANDGTFTISSNGTGCSIISALVPNSSMTALVRVGKTVLVLPPQG